MKSILALSLVLLFSLCVSGLRPVQGAAQGGSKQSATLTGAEEVPGPGDPDGTGTAKLILNHGQGTISFELTAANIAPAGAAHIHRGTTGVAGPIVAHLTPPTSGSSSGTANVDRALIKEIQKNPEAFYVNVHNADFPAGAIRGQLSKK